MAFIKTAKNDPERFAANLVREYQTGKDGKRLYEAGRALRFFDRGEGSAYWAKVINAVNPNVPVSRLEIAQRNTRLAQQKRTSSVAKLDNTVFPFISLNSTDT